MYKGLYYVRFQAPTGDLGMQLPKRWGGAALLNDGGHVMSKFFLSKGVPLSYFQRVFHLSNMGNSENTFLLLESKPLELWKEYWEI